MRLILSLFFAPALAFAQAAFPTDWPADAQSLTADVLRQRLVGKTFLAKSLTGSDVRTEYKDAIVFINTGETSDSGKWRTEGSSVCIEWKRLRAACSEVRAVGDVLYVKRANNGEVMAMLPK